MFVADTTRRRVRTAPLSLFALLVGEGMPTAVALERTAESTVGACRRAFAATARSIENGVEPSEAFIALGVGRAYAAVFASAIDSGRLSRAVAAFVEMRTLLDRAIRSILIAMAYPCAIIVAMTVGLAFLRFELIPHIATIAFVDEATLLIVSHRVNAVLRTTAWLAVLTAGVALTSGIESRVRYAIPGIGPVLCAVDLHGSFFVLSELITDGVPFDRALGDASYAARTAPMRHRLFALARDLQCGRSLVEAIDALPVPRSVRYWIAAAERSGNSAACAERLVVAGVSSVSNAIPVVERVTEYGSIVIVGGVLIFIAVAIVGPLLDAITAFDGLMF